jgi:hypothetical protein
MVEWLKERSLRAVLTLVVALIAAGLAISFPPDIAFLLAIDLGTWVEAAVAVYIAAQVTRIRPLMAFLRATFSSRVMRSGRQSRTPSLTSRDRQSSDDEPAPAAALGAAL